MSTIRTLSDYQLHELKRCFQIMDIQKIGRVDETGVLIVEAISLGSILCKKIPINPEPEFQDTEYEIVTPKQLTHGD